MLVATLSRYSICSFTVPLTIPAELAADTRPFFAMISSLTRFIRTSSFSVSTRTVRLTTGLPAGFLLPVPPACASFPAAGSAGAGTVSFFSGSGAGAASSFAGAGAASGAFAASGSAAFTCEGSNSPISQPSISETFIMISLTLSSLSSAASMRLKENSNFSSSISCAEGTDIAISPMSSRPLNTRKALAAFSMQLSWILTFMP